MKRILASGNYAAALAAIMARVEFISVYPITPQTEIIERLANFVFKKEFPIDNNLEFNPIGYVQSVGEFDAFAACVGASLLGKRCFTATSSQGGTFSQEIIYQAAWSRVPLVIAYPTRCRNTWNIWPSLFDFLAHRDTGWLQVYCKTPQEVFDRIIQAYKIAENKDVLLPIMVGYDGFITSYTSEPIDLPKQETVDNFLPPYSFKHIDPFGSEAISITTNYSALMYTEMRRRQREAMINASKVIKNVEAEFEKNFGRRYSSVVSYNDENANIILLGMGAGVSTALNIIKKYDGKVGLINLNWFRPFPADEIRKICENAKVLPFVVGEGGMDVSPNRIDEIIKVSQKYLENNKIEKVVAVMGDSGNILYDEVKSALYNEEETRWIGLEKKLYKIESSTKEEEYRTVSKGVGSCAGCGEILATRYILNTLKDRNPIVCIPASCMSVVCSGIVEKESYKLQNSTFNATVVHTPFAASASYATGISRALEISGSKRIAVVIAGDGATFDIGFNNVSGAAERNENFIYICYDNEAYGNTGMQRSGATPYGAITKTTPLGKKENKKDLSHIMIAHNIPYAATASVFNLKDLCRKVERAKDVKGFRFIHILTPCPPGWNYDPSKTIEIAKLADKIGIFPRWEFYNGKISIQTPRSIINNEDIEKYLVLQGRFKNISKDDIEMLKNYINERWEVLEYLSKLYG